MFTFESNEKITKELLLSKYSQEHYMEFYLGVPVKKGLFKSPSIIRADNSPTCSFYKNKLGNLIYNDFAGPSFDFIGAVMHIFQCSYYKALRIIANDFGFITVQNIEKNAPKIAFSGNELKQTEKSKIEVEIKEFSKKELDWWSGFGISKGTLDKFKVYSIKSVFLNGNYHTSSTETTPIYGYYGGENSDGDGLWRLYFPTKRNYRFLSNWSSNMWQGSKQLPKSSNHCFIIKSMKDLMNLFEFGFIAIAPTSENVLITDKQFQRLLDKFDKIFIFFDNDLPGVRGANKYKKKYDVKCIFIKRKYAKDISDLYKKISPTQFWDVVEELNQIINYNIRSTKHFYIF